MKRLAVPVFSIALAASFAAFALDRYPEIHPGYRVDRPSGAPIRANPLWRHPVRTGHFAHPPRFRHRGHTFIFIGAPLFAAPWLYYPYAMDAQWGARYFVPGEQEAFLFYCPDTGGFVPEGACPAGWWPVVPDDAPDPEW